MRNPAWVIAFLLWGIGAAVAAEDNWRGPYSGVAALEVQVARDQGHWQRLWGRIGKSPPMDLPDGKMAVAVFLGTRNTGGWKVAFAAIDYGRCATIVHFEGRGPGPDQYVTQALTTPFAVRLIDGAAAPVVFESSQGRIAPDGEPKPPEGC